MFNRGSIMDACLWRLLKTFVECIRQQTFSRAGYQQLQVDVSFLRLALADELSDAPLSLHLLDMVAIPPPLPRPFLQPKCGSK